MKIDIRGILEGVKNSIFLKEEIERVAEHRTEICKGCDFYSENVRKKEKMFRKDIHCTNCGCNIHLKTRALIAQCPLDEPKWKAVITIEENETLNQLYAD